jgi:hypothetical protein
MFNNPNNWDVMILCPRQRWYAHSGVLAQRSDVFAKEISKHASVLVNGTGVGLRFDLKDPTDYLESLLLYLYTLKPPSMRDDDAYVLDGTIPEQVVALFTLTWRLGVPGLRQLVNERILSILKQDTIFMHPEKAKNLPILFNQVVSLWTACEHNTEDLDLRRAATIAIARHARALLDLPSVIDTLDAKPSFRLAFERAMAILIKDPVAGFLGSVTELY